MRSVINCTAGRCGSPNHRINVYQHHGETSLTLSELDLRAHRVAGYLASQGLKQGDRIGIISQNCLEWVLLDLAAIKCKVVTAGFEAGRSIASRELMQAFGLKMIFADHAADVPGVRQIRELDGALIGQGEFAVPKAMYGADDVTTIKFTSGSTGKPKGLAATVGSIDSSLEAVQQMFGHGPRDKILVFLPLSLLQQRYWIYSALCHNHDVVVTTYELVFHALRREHPTVVMGVPGFFEVLRRKIEGRARELTSEFDQLSSDKQAVLCRECAAQILGTRIRYMWTGSAPASAATLAFFQRCNLPIYEGYGMNETCIVTKNHPGASRLGSVGKPVAGKSVYIDKDGVVIVRSRHPVNTQYIFCEPGESERIFLPNGDVRTGDLGYLDADGYLYVTGRADDVIALDNGKNVQIRPIEEEVKACAVIAECVLFGAGRPYLVAVISATDPPDASAIADHIKRVNGKHGKDQRIGSYMLSPEIFSVENGLLTSQYKPKRKEIFARFREQIAQLYGAPRRPASPQPPWDDLMPWQQKASRQGQTAPSFTLSGSPFDIGVQHGRAVGPQLRDFLADGRARIETLLGRAIDQRRLNSQLSRHAAVIEEDLPEIAEEIRGLATGADVSYMDALLLQMRREILGEARSNGECTTFAARADHGATIVAQNVDLNADLADFGYVLSVQPLSPNEPPYIIYTFGGLIGFVGLNAAQLAIGINYVESRDWHAGASPYLIVRHLLKLETVEQCIAELRRIRRSSSRCLVIADRNRVVAIELTVDDLRILETPLIFHTNHYLHPEFVARDCMNVFSRNASTQRLRRIRELMSDWTREWSDEKIFAAMSDHSLSPIGLCAHSDDFRREDTVASIVLRPAQGCLYARKGHPCTGVTQSYKIV
jgi:long-subunit acyl-CoA synthetase (AMP-forming)/predicted choloylglycine hydrolase